MSETLLSILCGEEHSQSLLLVLLFDNGLYDCCYHYFSNLFVHLLLYLLEGGLGSVIGSMV